MTETKHTPGPWVWDDGDGYGSTDVWAGCSPTGHGPAGRMIAQIVGDDAEVEANARLIAVAPELLALCIEMREWLKPEVELEPNRTFFWKLVEIISRAGAQ